MTLRIAGAASAPMPVLMRVRRSRRRSLVRYLRMAAPWRLLGIGSAVDLKARAEVYHIPAAARRGEQGPCLIRTPSGGRSAAGAASIPASLRARPHAVPPAA